VLFLLLCHQKTKKKTMRSHEIGHEIPEKHNTLVCGREDESIRFVNGLSYWEIYLI